MYSERMHEGLEMFVRSRGALLLLGPLSEAEWDAFFEPQAAGRRATFAGKSGLRVWFTSEGATVP